MSIHAGSPAVGQTKGENNPMKTEFEYFEQLKKDYPDVMSIEQMCEILSVSTKTGYKLLKEGKICCLKVGRAYRIPKAHLFTYLCIGNQIPSAAQEA